MASIPKLKDLFNDIIANIEAELNVIISLFGNGAFRAIAAVQAAKLRLYYVAIAFNLKNIFVDTADPESIGGTLERFGRVKLGRDPFPATEGQYTIDITGTIGATVPASTTFKSNDDSFSPGQLFILDDAYILIATTDQITVRALEAGLQSKLEVTNGLTATAPIINVDSNAVVVVESVAPLAAEDIEDYRQKAITTYQLESQGGAGTDYRIWSADAQGVQNVYPYATSGVDGEIDLYIEATKADSIDGKGTPTPAIIADVEAVVEFNPDTSKPLNERGRRPLTTFEIHYLTITPKDVDITIQNFVGLTVDIQTLIFNSVEAYIDTVRPFVASANIPANQNDLLSVTKIIQVVSNVIPVGTTFDTLTFTVDAVPVPVSELFENGDIPVLETISYI
jgi:hypothetical protein